MSEAPKIKRPPAHWERVAGLVEHERDGVETWRYSGFIVTSQLAGMDAPELARVESQYASVQLADGANVNAMATIGSIRDSAQDIQTQIGNLEQDSFSDDADLNSEVSVLNKINAAGVLTLRSLQDSNKLLASLLEQQTIIAKQQREATTNAINADISRRSNLAGNMAQVNSTLTSSLQNFRMP